MTDPFDNLPFGIAVLRDLHIARGMPNKEITDFSEPIVTDVENFECMSGGEIKNRILSFTPTTATEFAAAWDQFCESIVAATNGLKAEVRAISDDGFEGDLPDQIRDTHQSFINSSEFFSDIVRSRAEKLSNFSHVLSKVQARFPFRFIPTADPAIGLGGRSLVEPSPELAALMESTYSPAVLDAGNRLPVLPGPTGPSPSSVGAADHGEARPAGGLGLTSGPDTATLLGTGSASGGDPGSGASGREGSVGEGPGPGVHDSRPEAGSAGDGFRGDSLGADSLGGGRSPNVVAVSQAGLAPAPDTGQAAGQFGRGGAPGVPAGTTTSGAPIALPGAGGPAIGGARPAGTGGTRSVRPGLGGAGFAGSGAGSGAGSNSGSGLGGKPAGGAPGGSGTGGSGTGGPGTGGSPGAVKSGPPRGGGIGGPSEGGTNNAMAGRRGMNGGMMSGAGGGRGDKDETYTPAEFLTTIDNGSKLIGPLPRVVHPVIGVWHDA